MHRPRTLEELHEEGERWGIFYGTPEERMKKARLHSRLNMLPGERIPLAGFLSFCSGAALGTAQGAKMTGLRFRAEHAHKLPSTTTGWWLYHKSKNYQMAKGGFKEGIKMGVRVSFWTTAMFAIEDAYDSYRGTKDFVNTVFASVTVAGAFSLWNRFNLPMTARTTKTALLIGLVYGGLQDMAGVARGRPIRYIDFVRRKFRGGKNTKAAIEQKPQSMK